MNINGLASNPPWWFYLPFAVGTTLLTFVVWLIFKYSRVSFALALYYLPAD